MAMRMGGQKVRLAWDGLEQSRRAAWSQWNLIRFLKDGWDWKIGKWGEKAYQVRRP